MTWARFDDGFWCHPKVVAVSSAAVGVFVRLVCYCSQQLTDGEVSEPVVSMIAGTGDAINELASVGLIERTSTGWRIHDYLEYNPSAREVRKARAQTSVARAKAGRKGMAAKYSKIDSSANSHEKSDNKRTTNVQQTDNKTVTPFPSRSQEEPPLNPPNRGDLGTPPLAVEEPSPTPRLGTREHLGVDPHEIAINHLGKHCQIFAHFPGAFLMDFRQAARGLELSTSDWDVLGQWFSAGGTRTHRSNDPGWRWLLSGDVLSKSWAKAKKWNESGRPAISQDGRSFVANVEKKSTPPPKQYGQAVAHVRDAKAATPEEIAELKRKRLERMNAQNTDPKEPNNVEQ